MGPPDPAAPHAAAAEKTDGGAAQGARELERDLVARLRRGEGAALDRAFALHKDRLHRFLFHLCRRRDLAEDLLQETFLQLARHALRLAPDTDLPAWLFTVARNAWRAALRRQRAGDRALSALPEPRVDHGSDPERATESAAALARLQRVLAALPDDQRELLLLAASGELSSEQAATVLAIRPDAFRQRLSRARAELTRRLAEAEAPAPPQLRHAVHPLHRPPRRGDAP